MFCRRLKEAAVQEYHISGNSFQSLKETHDRFPTLNCDADCKHLFGVTTNPVSVSGVFRDSDEETVNLNYYDHNMAPTDENCNDELIEDQTLSSDKEDNVVEDESVDYSSGEIIVIFPNPINWETTASEDAGVLEGSTGRRRNHHKRVDRKTYST